MILLECEECCARFSIRIVSSPNPHEWRDGDDLSCPFCLGTVELIDKEREGEA